MQRNERYGSCTLNPVIRTGYGNRNFTYSLVDKQLEKFTVSFLLLASSKRPPTIEREQPIMEKRSLMNLLNMNPKNCNWETLLSINQAIFGLNDENFTKTLGLIINNFDEIHPLSYDLIILQMIYYSFVIKNNNANIFLNITKEIRAFEESNKIKSNIFDIFGQFLNNKNTDESSYLLEAMIEHNFLEPNIVKNNQSAYFVHYMSKDKLTIYLREHDFVNYEELSKNDWELHKKLIREGHNPNEISKIIRNDEIEKLQEISSQTNFDFNQKIKPSLYEICSFIDEDYVSLIDYAAFFSSVKCFKYLLMNGANLKNTGKYAIAGGNLEIIHLCEQNHSSFDNAYETAIEFHRNDIFKYFYDNKLKEINNLEKLGNLCILYHNSEIFSFLLKEGMEINNDIINEAAMIGNIFLVEYFLKEHSIPHDILVFSAGSRNIELVEYDLKQEGIDINVKDIYLLYLIFILII